jgi:hypothetical protein
MTTNYLVGYNDADDWYNYTRNYVMPLGPYYFFARLSSGGAANAVQLDEVVGAVNTTSQDLAKLGKVRGPASGDWGVYIYVPLRDESNALLPIDWSGEKTFRVTILAGGNENIDCYVLTPALSSGPAQLLEVMGTDMGADVGGFNGPLALSSLTVTKGGMVQLVDLEDNGGDAEPEALYVTRLVVPEGAVLDLNGVTLYAQEFQGTGTVLGGSVQIVVAQPPLMTIRQAGSDVEISWPASAAGYYLQMIDDLALTSEWQNVTDAPVHAGESNVVLQIRGDTTRFYRLRHD